MYPLSLALMIATEAARHEVMACLRALQGRVVLEETDRAEWNSFLSRLAPERPDIVIVDFTAFPQPWDELVQQIKAAAGASMVIALHHSADPETILGAIRSGANEYVYPPLEANLQKALDRLSQDWVKQRSESGTQGRVLGFLAAKGGCGATTVACLTSMAIQRSTRQQVLLADFDMSLGMVSFLMKTKSRHSIMDALTNTHRLDLSYWKALVSNGVPGLEVIPAPAAHELGESMPAERFRQVLRFARLHYDWVFVDLGRAVTLSLLSLLEEVDETYLVSTAEVPALYQVKRTAETLLSFGYSRDRLHLVLNRVPKNLDVTGDELEEMLGMPVYAMLPEDYDSLYEAYGAGQQLSVTSPLSRQIQKMGARIAGVSEEKAKKKFLLFG